MKKLLSLSLIFISILCIFSGCTINQGDSLDTTKENRTENISEQQLTNLNCVDGYKLRVAELLKNSRLLLAYQNNDDQKYQFRQYDLKKRSFVYQSEEYSTSDFEINSLCFLSENFYVLSKDCCFVFDFNCNLIQKLPIPENISERFGTACYWLSDNLQKIAYVKNPKLEAEYLYTSASDGQNEKQVRMLEADLTITGLFFSTDSNYLGFEGVTIPAGKNTSIGCYGYIDLHTMQTTMYPDNKTYVVHQGNMMLICDKTAAPDATRKGVVKILNLETKEKAEIVMDTAEECETANFGSDVSFIVGMHKVETTYTITFTIYKDGKKINAVDYICPSEQTYIDLSSGGTQIRMDMETKQIFAFYYNTEQNNYTILSVPFVG